MCRGPAGTTSRSKSVFGGWERGRLLKCINSFGPRARLEGLPRLLLAGWDIGILSAAAGKPVAGACLV